MGAVSFEPPKSKHCVCDWAHHDSGSAILVHTLSKPPFFFIVGPTNQTWSIDTWSMNDFRPCADSRAGSAIIRLIGNGRAKSGAVSLWTYNDQ
jgi:hypothetical protein